MLTTIISILCSKQIHKDAFVIICPFFYAEVYDCLKNSGRYKWSFPEFFWVYKSLLNTFLGVTYDMVGETRIWWDCVFGWISQVLDHTTCCFVADAYGPIPMVNYWCWAFLKVELLGELLLDIICCLGWNSIIITQ